MEVLLSDENEWVELRQGVGCLVNTIIAVLGLKLAPGSTFFFSMQVSCCRDKLWARNFNTYRMCEVYPTTCSLCTSSCFYTFSCSNSSSTSIF